MRDVLVLRALGVGDLLTAVPALRAIRRAFPQARLRLATSIELGDLVGLIGGIDDIVPTAGLTAMGPWGGPPDVAVNLHGRGPRSSALLRRTDPAALWCHREPGRPGGGPEWDDDLHEVDRWCRLLRHHGVDADPTDLRVATPPACPPDRVVVVHPGAASAARRWPAARFAQVARALADGGRVPVVVTGGPGESGLVEQVCRDAGPDAHVRPAAPRRLRDVAALVAHARLVICGDTGIAHLATAFATPSVVLFGPTPPRNWGPRIDAPLHTVLWAGRRGDPHGSRLDPGLASIGVAQVESAARDHLTGHLTGRTSRV